eukprot:m.44069 g.44069  ORF g.44069 m.44069 type:complete len:127 (+) comp19564_c0_seq3:221-601(+)
MHTCVATLIDVMVQLIGVQFLALPLPEEGKSIALDVSTGQPVRLDHLGPVVVQSDGKLKRITNWNEMTEREQKTAFRMVTKRNRRRLAELREAQASKSAEQQQEEETREKSPTPPPLAIEGTKEEL